jgi:hypothetical protein
MTTAASTKEDRVLSQTVREFGGAFSKSSRFSTVKSLTPGPKYDLSCETKEQVLGHIRGPRIQPRLVQNPQTKYDNDIWKAHSNPYAERSGFMMGSNRETTGDKVVFTDFCERNGPAAYNTDPASRLTRNNATRTVFGKSRRFLPVDKLTITAALFEQNKCMGSPGPHLLPGKGLIDFTKHSPESYTFGSGAPAKTGGKSSIDRKFINTEVKDDMLYHKDAGSGPAVSSHNYVPKPEVVEEHCSRPVFSKAHRFDPAMKLAPYTKHDEIPLQGHGERSPGPSKYNPVHGLETSSGGKHRMSQSIAAGNWCP